MNTVLKYALVIGGSAIVGGAMGIMAAKIDAKRKAKAEITKLESNNKEN